MKKEICKDCKEKYWKSQGHVCPDIWIASLGYKSIIVYARDKLEIEWKKGKIILSGKKK